MSAPKKEDAATEFGIYDTKGGTYYRMWTAIGPCFGGTEETAHRFPTRLSAVMKMGEHSFAFAMSEIRELKPLSEKGCTCAVTRRIDATPSESCPVPEHRRPVPTSPLPTPLPEPEAFSPKALRARGVGLPEGATGGQVLADCGLLSRPFEGPSRASSRRAMTTELTSAVQRFIECFAGVPLEDLHLAEVEMIGAGDRADGDEAVEIAVAIVRAAIRARKGT